MKNCPRVGCASEVPAAEWMNRLRGQAGRVTRSRRGVLEALRKLQRPSTPKEIAEALEEGGCDLATVYRSMALFESMGLVHRIDFGDGLARFEIADADPRGHHHHHLVCRQCRRIVRLDDCILAEVETRLARQHGFRHIRHRLEFFGICPDCQTTPKPATRPRKSARRSGRPARS